MARANKRKHISTETKQNVIHLYYNRHHKQEDIAADLRIGLSTVEKILTRYRRDSAGLSVPTLRVRGRPRLLHAADVDFLIGLVQRTPDMYLHEMQAELRERCDVDASLRTIWMALRRRGYNRKRVSRVAAQRDEEARTNFEIYMAVTYRAEQLVFVDEAACNRNTTKRGWAWAPVGEQARRHDVYIRGVKYSVLPALSLSGVLHLDVLAGSYNAASFNSFIDGLLDNMNQFPGPNSVIVMDNASIHKSEALRPMIEQRGMRLEYLPPYSPDYDPIEEGFSAFKAWVRRHRDYTDGALAGGPNADSPYTMIWRGIHESMTAEKARGWFAHSGYV